MGLCQWAYARSTVGTKKFNLWREPNKEWQELCYRMEINGACAPEQAAKVDGLIQWRDSVVNGMTSWTKYFSHCLICSLWKINLWIKSISREARVIRRLKTKEVLVSREERVRTAGLRWEPASIDPWVTKIPQTQACSKKRKKKMETKEDMEGCRSKFTLSTWPVSWLRNSCLANICTLRKPRG